MKKQMGMVQGLPRVTILMPIFNAMPFLPEAVESILAQTFSSFVLLALDDGSTDGSLAFLNSLRDSRVRVVSGGKHMGLGAILNQGIAIAGTEFVARMDADDVCAPERLEKQVAFLDRNPEIGAVGTQFTYLGTQERKGFGRILPLHHDGIIRDLRKGELSLIHASLMLRTDVVRGIGGYRFAGVGEDWDMFLRFGEVSRFANLPELMYFYRVHDTNASMRQLRMTLPRIRYACRCAEARLAGLAEPEEAAFLRMLARRPAFERGATWLDAASLARYARGRNQVLQGVALRGYMNLSVSALLSPRRLLARLNPVRWLARPAAAGLLPSGERQGPMCAAGEIGAE